MTDNPSIGYVIGGTLKESFRVRLTVDPLTVQEGAFVVIESGDYHFYGLVTDMQLGATDDRFADEKSVHIWETSYIRQKLSHEADAFSRKIRQEATGLETWFSVPECPQLETPPEWKMAIVTFIGVYILSIIIIKLEEIFIKGADFYLLNILTVALLVSTLTWVVMPFFSRHVFRKWLYK